VTGWLRVLRGAIGQGFAELRAFYTWRTWFGGWLVRLLTQVTFFALLGRLINDRETIRYIAVGNAVALVSIEACVVVLSMCGERMTGTLPLIVAAPGSHLPVYLGRGVQWLCTGLVSSTTALVVVPWLLGVRLPVAKVLTAVPMLAVIGLATYCYGCFLGGVALRLMSWQWLVLNLGYLVLLTFCGVNVPIDFWPWPLHALAEIMPLTHGLAGIRAMLAGDTGRALAQLCLEAAVGAGWLSIAAVSTQRLVSRGRVDGSIEFT